MLVIMVGDVFQHAHHAVLGRAQALHFIEGVLVHAFNGGDKGRAVAIERRDHRGDSGYLVVRGIRDLDWLSAQRPDDARLSNVGIYDVAEHFLHRPTSTARAE
jgi:hypothetical protein